MKTRNPHRTTPRHPGAALFVALALAAACHDTTPQTSSSSNWLTCDTGSDCVAAGAPDRCETGYCIGDDGQRIEITETDGGDCQLPTLEEVTPFDTCDAISDRWTVHGDVSLCECVQLCEADEECAPSGLFDYNEQTRSCITDSTCAPTELGYRYYGFGPALEAGGEALDEGRPTEAQSPVDEICEEYCRMEDECLVVPDPQAGECYPDCLRWRGNHQGCGFEAWAECIISASCDDAVAFFGAHPDGVVDSTPCGPQYLEMSCLDFEPRAEYASGDAP